MNDGSLNPVLKQMLLFMGSNIAISFVIVYFFDFIVGIIVNIAIFIGAIFYIRRKKMYGSGSTGFKGKSFARGEIKLTYVCLSCGRKVTGKVCSKCGSKMRKPLF